MRLTHPKLPSPTSLYPIKTFTYMCLALGYILPLHAQVSDITIDNNQAEIAGNWSTSTFENNYFGSDYLYATQGGSSDSIEWRPDLATSGVYQVMVRLPDGDSSRPQNAPFVIHHANGTTTVDVDQTTTPGGRWKSLGRFQFDAGTQGYVSLSDNYSATGTSYLIADAVRFVTTNIVLDNDDAEVTGSWSASSFEDNYYGDDYLYKNIDDGSADITWQPKLPGSGDYDVYYRLPDGNYTRTNNAAIQVNHALGSSSYNIDQTVSAGGQWIHLGNHQFFGGTAGSVVLSDDGTDTNKIVIADAIRLDNQTLTDSAFNVALGATATASSITDGYSAHLAIDGQSTNASRWLSADQAGPHWLALDLGHEYEMQCAIIFNGYDQQSGIDTLVLQTYDGTQWQDIPDTEVTGNTDPIIFIHFNEIIAAQQLRLYSQSSQRIKIKDFQLFSNNGACPDFGQSGAIYVNQSGYDIDLPKRFTAPEIADNTSFQILDASTRAPVYSGHIIDGTGDFSNFTPGSPFPEYVIVSDGKESDPFGIGQDWNERVSYQNAIDFMAGSRCYVGTDNSCINAVGWRDGHQFSFELPTLAALYLSNPSLNHALPNKINYTTIAEGIDYGSASISAPPANAPDVIKLIVWALDRYHERQVNHPLFKEQLAFFLHAYPDLSDYIGQQTYNTIRDYTFNIWSNTARDRYGWHENTTGGSYTGDLLQTYTNIGDGKGSFPPGHSILPNLMMYEVALREGRNDADDYLTAAFNQTQWLISNVDWQDPTTTKGQRMSEHVTMEGLAYFAAHHLNDAPIGLLDKINDWATVVVSRSDNLWDFRKYDDSVDQWVIPGLNEPGNIMGLPAAIYAAIPHLTDPMMISRLEQIAVAHIDNAFGRNPTGRHFSHDAPRDFEGVERGWYEEHDGGYGRLNDVIGVFDGAPKPQHYPFNPNAGNPGWTEGWVAFNSAWNSTLAYASYYKTQIDVYNSSYSATPASLAENTTLYIELQAPLNLNYSAVENAEVIVTSSNGEREVVTVTETGANSGVFRVSLPTSTSGTLSAGDGVLTVTNADDFEVSYGLSYFKKSVVFSGDGSNGFIRQ